VQLRTPREETRLIEALVLEIERLKEGLDPEVLAHWYHRIKEEARSQTPDYLKESIEVIQDPILPMKFEFKTSRRAVKYISNAIDRNLASMPTATRLYFQKLEELMMAEMNR
jgi:hypothetical protein